MPKGKPWSPEEEKQLRDLIEGGNRLGVIVSKLGKTREAVRQKMLSLGLKEQQQTKNRSCCSSIPKELPSVEESLKILIAALNALKQSGLEQSEVLRLRSIIQGVKIYKDLFADYVDYRGIETQFLELRQKYEELAKKTQSVPT
jgi:hypothetical protein